MVVSRKSTADIAPTNEVFNTALEEYISALDPLDRELFQKAIVSPEDLVTQALDLEKTAIQRRDKSRIRLLVRRLTNAVEDFKGFFKAIEVGLSNSSPITALIWGGLRVVIEMVHMYAEYFDAIISALETVSIDLKFYNDYARTLYGQTPGVQRALADVYGDIFAIYTAVRKIFKDKKGRDRSVLSTMLHSFRGDLDGIVERLSPRQEVLEKEAKHADRVMARQEQMEAANERIKQEQERTRQEHERTKQDRERTEAKQARKAQEEKEAKEAFAKKLKKFRTVLDPIDCIEKHSKTFKVRRREECWLLERPAFRDWETSSQGLLWCHAKPGAGKTVLAATIINALKAKVSSNPRQRLVYFYCQFDDNRRRDATVVLASLLDQLLAQEDPDKMNANKAAIVEENCECRSLHDLDLKELLVQATKDLQIFIVVDALDECSTDRETLLDGLRTLATCGNVLVTSRRDEDSTFGLSEFPQIAIQPSDVYSDISHFVTNEVERNKKLCKRSAALKKEITNALVDRADGMFLWVKLQIDNLCSQRTERDIRLALEQLPIGLSETYDRAVRKIQSSPSAKWSIRVIQWTMHAVRPLTLKQLAEAVAIDEMDENNWDGSRVIDDPLSLVFDCENLVICSEEPNPWGDSWVQFIHTSVSNYFHDEKAAMIFPASENIDAQLATKCLKYLTMKLTCDPDVLLQTPLDAPLVAYASYAWYYHLKSLEAVDEATLRLFRGFCDIPAALHYYGGGSALHIALSFDLNAIAEALINDETFALTCTNALDQTVLHLAAQNDKWLQSILDRADNTESIVFAEYIAQADSRQRSALHYAAAAGNHASIKLLLSRDGVNIHAVDTDGATPLHLASGALGAEEAVNLLLDGGAQIEATDFSKKTPLFYAGDYKIVKTLINRNANVNASANDGTTPLHLAVTGPEALKIVKLFTERGADIGPKDSTGKTPLHLAAGLYPGALGVEDVVRYLAEHGADVNACDNTRSTSLHSCCSQGNVDVANILLELGADPHVRNSEGKTPLHLAALVFNGTNNVKLLVEHGADCNAVDKDLCTPAHLACIGNSESAMYLIREAGCDTSVVDIYQRTLLLCCAQSVYPQVIDVVQHLVEEKGANIHDVDPNGRSVLHISATVGNVVLGRYLLQQGLTVNIFDDALNNPLHTILVSATCSTLLPFAELLVENDIDLSASNQYRQTALNLCARRSTFDTGLVVKLLVEHGADVNAADLDMKTPLHHAASNFSSSSWISHLLERGADANAADVSLIAPLHYAAGVGNSSVVSILLSHGANAKALDNADRLPIHYACGADSYSMDFDCIEQLSAVSDITAADSSGATPVHHAAGALSSEASKVVELLIRKGCSTDCRDNAGNTPLLSAAHRGTMGTFRVLIDHGVEVNDTNTVGYMPIHYAAGRSGGLDPLRLLLENGADPNALSQPSLSEPRETRLVVTPLQLTAGIPGNIKELLFLLERGADVNPPTESSPLLAAVAQDESMAMALLDKGANPNFVNSNGETPLHLCIFGRVMKRLIELGVDVNARTSDGKTPLHNATFRVSSVDDILLLLDNGASVNPRNKWQWTPLHLAAVTKQAELVKVLIERGVDPNVREETGNTPALLAAKRSDGLAVLKLLKEYGADLEVADEHGSTCLHWAMCLNKPNTAEWLIDNVNNFVVDQDGITPLMLASETSLMFEVVRTLVEGGASISAVDIHGVGPLHHSASSDEAHETTKYLLEHGADVHWKDDCDSTALSLASSESGRGGSQTVKYILEHGGRATDSDVNKCTPLHWACYYGVSRTVELLLDAGADPNAFDIQHCTPLHLAASNLKIFRTLLSRGANILLKDNKGKTAVHYALRAKSFDVQKVLNEYGIATPAVTEEGPALRWIPALFADIADTRRAEIPKEDVPEGIVIYPPYTSNYYWDNLSLRHKTPPPPLKEDATSGDAKDSSAAQGPGEMELPDLPRLDTEPVLESSTFSDLSTSPLNVAFEY